MSKPYAKFPNVSRKYGVLVGQIHDAKEDPPSDPSPHYEIWVRAGEADFRIAVNVQSLGGSEVLAYYEPNYTNPTKLNLSKLASAAQGFQALETGMYGKGLDYLRDNLFPLERLRPLPADGGGVSLRNILEAQIGRAKADAGTVVIAFGQAFIDLESDSTFGFSPERGMHDIHMMQGNQGDYARDNQVNGDGALFIRFPSGETAALFIRFQQQGTHTDPNTGAQTGAPSVAVAPPSAPASSSSSAAGGPSGPPGGPKQHRLP